MIARKLGFVYHVPPHDGTAVVRREGAASRLVRRQRHLLGLRRQLTVTDGNCDVLHGVACMQHVAASRPPLGRGHRPLPASDHCRRGAAGASTSEFNEPPSGAAARLPRGSELRWRPPLGALLLRLDRHTAPAVLCGSTCNSVTVEFRVQPLPPPQTSMHVNMAIR